MKGFVVCLLMTWLIGLPIAKVVADCERIVVSDSNLTIVPFAIPVAVPVATAQPGQLFYQYSGSQNSGFQSGGGGYRAASHPDPELQREFQAFLAWRTKRGQASVPELPQVAQISLIEKHCGACHAGTKPKSELSLAGQLSDVVRLKAIGAVLSGEMPKNKTLSAQEIGLLLQELAGEQD